MPKGYAIFTEDIHDTDSYQRYVEQALPTVLASGGRPIVVEDAPDLIEGRWHGPRTVILEFESVDEARAWYESPEYQAIVGQRHACSECSGIIAGGFELPQD